MMQSLTDKVDIGRALELAKAGRPVTEKMYALERPAVVLDPCRGVWCADVELTADGIGSVLGISPSLSDEGVPFTRDGETLCTGACVFIGMRSPLDDEDVDAIMSQVHVGSWLSPQGRLLAVTRVWGSQ